MASIPRVGTEFAGYRIEAQLGRGGMSVVYRAENVRLANKIALKLIDPELAEDEKFRERFVRESRAAGSLSHPNVIPIYDAGDHEGLLYIAMRYVPYLDLKAVIERDAPLPLEQAIAIVAQVASALDAAHAQGLVHRDVKPANILIEPRAERELPHHVYLSDFGISKLSGSESGITGTGAFLGTVDYVSPEQVRGDKIDGRTDIYSLGCVLYECLTGVPPYRKDENYAVLFAHVQEPAPQVTRERPELPSGLDAVVAKALAKSPDDRYQTGAELVAALRAAAAASNGKQSPPEAAPVKTPHRPHRPHLPHRAAPEERSPEEPRRRWHLSPVRLALAGAVLGAAVAAAVVLALTGGGNKAPAPVGSSAPTAQLAGVVPGAIWKNCELVRPRAGALETAMCLPPAKSGGTGALVPDRLEVSLFKNSAGAKKEYETQVIRSHIRPNTGTCSGTSWGGEGPWVHGPGKPGGRRVCFFEGDRTLIAWIHEGFGQSNHRDVLGIAELEGVDHPSLFDWWRVWVHRIGKIRAA